MVDSLASERQRDDHFFHAALRWLSRNEVSSVSLACQHSQAMPLGTKRRPALEVQGCLQHMPLYRLVDLFLGGVRDVAVVHGDCCANTDAAIDIVSAWQSRLGELLVWSTIERKPARNWTWSLSPVRVPVDRRGLLGLSRQSENPWPVHDIDADAEHRLVTSLRAAGVTAIEEPPTALALVASGCTACGVCVAACPHDALTLIVDGAKTSLHHAPDTCQGEQQCVALCPVEALSIVGPLDWPTVLDGAPQVLATLQMVVCERCRTRFPTSPGQRWCETCRIRRSDPFGSHLPEAAIKLLKARGHDRPL